MLISLMIVVGFGLTILVHEWGHFIMARRAGVHVETFSIGMGPKLLTLYRDKKGTEYIIALLPIGGYVKMKGQEDLPSLADNPSDIPPDSYLAKTPLQRLSIILAGVVMNAIFAILLLVIAFTVGVPFSDNRIAGTVVGSPASKFDFKSGDEIVAINGKKIDCWEDLLTRSAFLEAGNNAAITVRRDGQLIPFTLAPESKPKGNDLEKLPHFGFLPLHRATIGDLSERDVLYSKGLRAGMVVQKLEILEKDKPVFTGTTLEAIDRLIVNHPGGDYRVEAVADDGQVVVFTGVLGTKKIPSAGYMTLPVVDVIPGGAADGAGLKSGDQILSIDGKLLRGWNDLLDVVGNLRSDKGLDLEVKRGSDVIHINVAPRFDAAVEQRYLLGLKPQIGEYHAGQSVSWVDDGIKDLPDGLRIGDHVKSAKQVKDGVVYQVERLGQPFTLMITEAQLPKRDIGVLAEFSEKQKVVRYPLGESLLMAFPRGIQELQEVYLFLGKLVSGKMSTDMVGGPIRIFEFSYVAASVKGWSYFLLIFAKIGFSLAVMNLLPIPVLDGGHAVTILYEMIVGRPIPSNILKAMMLIGFVLLLALMALTTFNDISHLLK